MYARRAAVLCNGECSLRDELSNAQKEGRRAWCVLPAAATWSALCFVALAAKATLRGQAADQLAISSKLSK